MKQILYVLIFGFNLYLSLLLQAQNLPYKNVSKNFTVTLSYWQQLNGFFAYNEKLPEDCNIKSTVNKCIVICASWVKIIINKKQLLNWKQQQKKTGFINLHLPKLGIMHEHARITKIKKVTHKTPTNKNQHLVTAFYMRYAHVLKYKIKDIDTGKIEEITTTPEHKFYETTYKKFMSIGKLRSSNAITNESHHHLKIICNNNSKNNCGTAVLNSLQKTYNMKVQKAHNYFVGKMKILVHNGCYDHYYRCRSCAEVHAEICRFSDICEKTEDKKHYFMKFYQCEFCGLSSKSKNTISDHGMLHKSGFSRYMCAECGAKCKNESALSSHNNMHINNNYTIFCCECNTRIPLKDKLEYVHEHKLYAQSKNPIDPHFKERSRSPIIDFFKRIDTMDLLNLENLDLPDLSSYDN